VTVLNPASQRGWEQGVAESLGAVWAVALGFVRASRSGIMGQEKAEHPQGGSAALVPHGLSGTG